MRTCRKRRKRLREGARTTIACILVMLLSCLTAHAVEPTTQISVPRIDKMPNLPAPYAMRDWKQVARDYDAFVFDFNKQGKYLPVPWWDKRHLNNSRDTFAMPAYIGSHGQVHGGEAYDVITSMGAVLGATLVGIDKSNQHGQNWVLLCEGFFNSANGQNLYLNNSNTITGTTFWYDLLPSLLFYHLYYHYPGTGKMEEHFRITADRWREACIGMGAKSDPFTPPDFDHTGFDMLTGKTFDNPLWREPDAAGGVAWLEYLAYVKTGEKKYLEAAQWAIGFLDKREKNCFYEVILPYGIYASARMNAELGENHDTDKLLNWVVNGDNPRGWGVSVGRWGDYDCSGLLASVAENQGYAFPMDTYIAAGVIAPMVRYDDRYSRAIGKWMLNLVNSSRFWYANAIPPDNQTDYAWSKANDPSACIAYEGLRQHGHRRDRVNRDVSNSKGEVVSGSFKETIYQDKKSQMLTEKDGALEHIWKLSLSPGKNHTLVVWGNNGAPGQRFKFSIATDLNAPWTRCFVFDSEKETHHWRNLDAQSDAVYLKVESDRTEQDPGESWKISIDDIYVETVLDKSPYAMGDPTYVGWGATDFSLYGSSFVGMIGAMVEPTNVEGILQFDCVATEAFPPKCYPTYLYFNPHQEAKDVEINVGQESRDLYDAAMNRFLAREATGKVYFTVPADSAVLLVVCPAKAKLEHQGYKTLIDGVVIDYNNGLAPLPSAQRPERVDRSRVIPAKRDARSSPSISIDTKPSGGKMACGVRFAWDERYLHIDAVETAPAAKRKEASDEKEFSAAPFASDSIGLFLDLDNSNDAPAHGDFNLWLGFSSTNRTDLLTGRPHSSEQCSAPQLSHSSVETGLDASGHRTIHARIAWDDLARAVAKEHQPSAGLAKAISPGFRFGCEVLLVENSYATQSFIGGNIKPEGRDVNSRDILLE